MTFDRKIFFDGVKARIDSSLDQNQVDGLNFLLDQFEQSSPWTDIRWIAYAFATTAHETNYSFQPVEEGYYLEPKHGKAFLTKFQKGLRYYPYFGRGYVQLTWEGPKIKNYSKATRELKKQLPDIVARFESEAGHALDLVKNPEDAMNPYIAFAVMVLGMQQGWFTGEKLADFIGGNRKDYYNARTIINGHDKAGAIEKLAERFEQILRAAKDSTAPAKQSTTSTSEQGDKKEAVEQITATGRGAYVTSEGMTLFTPHVAEFVKAGWSVDEAMTKAKELQSTPASEGTEGKPEPPAPVEVRAATTTTEEKAVVGGFSLTAIYNMVQSAFTGLTLERVLLIVACLVIAYLLWDRAQKAKQERTKIYIETALDSATPNLTVV